MQDQLSSLELRKLLPDIALHIDKAFLLARLRPLDLDISTDDETVAIRIRLTNGFTLVLTPAGTMNGDYPSWTCTERVTHAVETRYFTTSVAAASLTVAANASPN